jgi:endonuclease/exonuclease/phosphatase family metal-dependent hydrolase
MRLLTWNLNGLDPTYLDERTEAAVFTAIVGTTLDKITNGAKPWIPPDVVCFQEVTAHTFRAHVQPHMRAGGYTVLPNVAPERQTFEVVAVRAPYVIRTHLEVPLVDSVFGRILHTVDVSGPLGDVRVATSHFDSGTEAGLTRKTQLQQVAEAIGERGVFGGDANFRKNEWLDAKSGVAVTDAWEAVGEPSATRFTWFMDSMKARFDRVWVGPGLAATSMLPVGDKEIAQIRARPSDHIGLLVSLAEAPMPPGDVPAGSA